MSDRPTAVLPVPFLARERLESLATGRETSAFASDMLAVSGTLHAAIEGRRIAIIGGAGSIGSAVARAICGFHPAALHVIDQDENGLAELVRDLRSGLGASPPADFRLLPGDFGAAPAEVFLDREGPYDAVLNFAAVKHVRSEKDVYSLVHMYDQNLRKQARLMERLYDSGFAGRYFTVSTDKAANPVSLMGASKRLMEAAVFAAPARPGLVRTSARFANVAFSNGSLLASFLARLAKGQPIPSPRDTTRYFVSHAEAAEICLLAAFAAPDGAVCFPKLDPSADLKPLETIARAVIAAHGFEPSVTEDESAARLGVTAARAVGRWPLLLTPRDTSGEKPYEEFVGAGETSFEIGLATMAAVHPKPSAAGTLEALVAYLEKVMAHGEAPDRAVLVGLIAAATPNFAHIDTGKSLDARI